MKKVRFTISDFMNEIIKSDSEYFKIPVGRIGNIIFKYYMDKDLNKVELGNFSGEVIQFNLNKESNLIYYDVLRENNAQNESEFMRSLLIRYATNPKNKRELFIFKESVERLNLAIKDKKSVHAVS